VKNFDPSHLAERDNAIVRRVPDPDAGPYALAAEEQRSILESSVVPVNPQQLDVAWGLGPTRSGVQINERTALTYVAVFAATRILSEALAMLPTKVFEGDEDSDDNRPATKHELYPRLRYEPNPEMTAATWKETGQGHLCLWGNHYSRIVFSNGGKPKYLLPLSPDTKPERFAGQLLYTVPATGDRFAPEEIVHVPGLGYNGIQGLSPIGLARETIAAGKAAELFGAAYWGNGTHVGGTLEFSGTLDAAQRAAARQTLAEMHTGVGNAHRSMILDRGGKYTPRSINANEAQFIETKVFSVRDIARLYRIPPHMLGDIEKASYNSIEQMSLEFLVYSLTPWLTKWEQELTRKLFGVGSGFFVRFDTRGLQRADHTAKQAYYASGRQWGYLSANDIRRKEGDGPIANGDIYLQPTNMQPAGTPPPAPAANAGDDAARANQDDRTAASAQLADCTFLRGVFEDAFARMLKVETNALRRAGDKAKTPDWQRDFYTSHETNMRSALTPASRSLCAHLGKSDVDVEAVVAGLAETRHAADVDVAAAAAASAGDLMTRLLEACKK
jgi:HK97 family phage portal protein